MERLRIYEVSDDYINFMKTNEKRVYENHQTNTKRKYVGPLLEIKGVKFYAPMSSPKESDFGKFGKRANTLTIIRLTSKDDLLGTLRLSHMIPVIPDQLIEYDALDESNVSYQALIFKQFDFISKHNDRIIKNAIVLEKQKRLQKKYFTDEVPQYLQNSFNFEELAKASGRFTAYKNDLARQALQSFAAEKKEFNKGNRFEEEIGTPNALKDIKAVDDKSLNDFINSELKKEQEKLKSKGLDDVQVGFDYEDDYYYSRKNDINHIKPETKKPSAIDLLKTKEEEIVEEQTLEAKTEDVIDQEIEDTHEEQEQDAKKDELFPNLNKAMIASKLVSSKALANSIKTIKFKGTKTTTIVGNLFKRNEVLYEMIDYSPIANVALLKNLDQKKIVLVYDFPRKGSIDWSEERNYQSDMWRALLEFNRLNS